MPETIKFRVWRKDLNKFKTIPQELVGKRCAPVCTSTEQDKFCAFFIKSTESIIYQQSSELKDRRGKEIYEGDILEYSPRENIERSPVTFEEGAFFVGDDLLVWVNAVSLVIGNIFENPDLIK